MEECLDLADAHDKCAYATDHCDTMMQLYYCNFGGSFFGLVPLVRVI